MWYENGKKKPEMTYKFGEIICLFNNDDIQITIKSLIDDLNRWGMEELWDTGIKSFPDNQFDVLVRLPECYVKSDEPKQNGNWWFSNDTIHYGFEDKCYYDSESGTIEKF